MVRQPPTVALRESQWRKAWAAPDRREFVIVVENPRGELVGFADSSTRFARSEWHNALSRRSARFALCLRLQRPPFAWHHIPA
jgi:hypothetical protein